VSNKLLLDLLASPEIASKRLVWRQYDHQVGTNTVVGPGSDAAVIRIKGTKKALAIAVDGNAAYTYLDPYMGGAIAVAEAARNVACTGARPIGMTNCLNFGNPEKPDQYYQLHEAIRGMSDAAKALGIPVISGNVSLYNESNGDAIWPTPVVGVVGLIDDVDRVVPMGFQVTGDRVLVVCPSSRRSTTENTSVADFAVRTIAREEFAGSDVIRIADGISAGQPAIDVSCEASLIDFLITANAQDLLRSAHDMSGGGLATALAECCIDNGIGATLAGDETFGLGLFCEPQSFVVLSCSEDSLGDLLGLVGAWGLQLVLAGETGGERLVFEQLDIPISTMREAYETGLARALEGVAANV
jgi:phosphoribosylformylglycinamidine synthase